MMRMNRLAFLAVCAALLAGCGVPAQTVSLAPEAKVAMTNVGHGKTVALRVVDTRTDKVLGYRDMDRSKTAPLTVEGDLNAVVGQATSKALNELGFAPVAYKEGAPRSLTVTIRELGYRAESQNVTKKVAVKCVLAVKAINGQASYEGAFPVSQEKEVVMTPNEDDNARLVNAVLSESLTMLMADPELTRFLARDTAKGKNLAD